MGARAFLLAFLMLSPCALAAEPESASSCSLALRDHSAYVRYPEQAVSEASLLFRLIENTERSISEVFEPAVNSGAILSDYVGTIKRQHEILSDDYGGYLMVRGRNHSSGMVYPGKLVTEQPMGRDDPIARINVYEYSDARISWQKRAYKFPKGVQKNYTRIEWLSENMLPYNEIYTGAAGSTYTHTYPKPRDLNAYLDRMNQLIRLVMFPSDARYVLWHLADYYHVAINSHAFRRGNNSLFMSQVNFFLKRMGLKPIPHLNLDFEAITLDFNEFRYLFVDVVKRYNADRDVMTPP